jgi:dolichyl-phosphate beta-glucosyltransferase
MILSLGALIWVNGVSTRRQGPYAAIAQLPVIEGALPTRFGLLAALFAGTLLAFAVHGLSTAGVRRGSPATGALLATGLSLACLAPLTPSPLPVVVAAAVPTYFVTTARHLPRNSVIMVLPFPGPDHPVAMRWQAAAHYGFRMPGGYFLGPDADGHAYIDGHTWSATGGLLRSVARNGLPAVVTINRRHQVAADLRTWGVDRVVLGPDPAQAALRVTVSALLNAQPNHVGGVDVWTLRGPTGKSALQHCDPPPFLLCTVPPLVNE